VCVSVCVCAKKFVSGYITSELTDLNAMLQLASNQEPHLASIIGPIFPHNLVRG